MKNKFSIFQIGSPHHGSGSLVLCFDTGYELEGGYRSDQDQNQDRATV